MDKTSKAKRYGVYVVIVEEEVTLDEDGETLTVTPVDRYADHPEMYENLTVVARLDSYKAAEFLVREALL